MWGHIHTLSLSLQQPKKIPCAITNYAMAAFQGLVKSKPPMRLPKGSTQKPPIAFTCAILFSFWHGEMTAVSFKDVEKHEPTNFLHEVGQGREIQRTYFHFRSQVFFIVVVVVANDHEAHKGIKNNTVNYFRTSYCASHIWFFYVRGGL